MNTVFICGPIEEIGTETLKKKGFSVDAVQAREKITGEHLKEIFARYDAVVTMVYNKVDEAILAAASPKLKIIANYGVGYDNIDVLAAKQKGIVVANTPAVAGESVAEHTFALILACAKRLVEADRYVRSGLYHGFDPKAFVSPQVWGQTIGIVGLGRIGTYVGHIAYGGFKMNILYYDVTKSEDFEMLTEAKFSSLDELLKNSDIVSLHVPLNEKTKHMIGRDQFMLMKNSAILINTARGPIINEQDLIWALNEGEIGAAGLDVFEDETNIPHELKTTSKVILTPHTASATQETRDAMSRITAQNIIDVFSGKNPVGAIKTS